MGELGSMNSALRLARVAPTAARSFKTSAPANGVLSTVGGIGILGVMVGPALPGGPAFVAQYLAKDEHKTLAWMGGMAVFGTMCSMGGGGAEAAPAYDFDYDAFFAEFEKDSK